MTTSQGGTGGWLADRMHLKNIEGLPAFVQVVKETFLLLTKETPTSTAEEKLEKLLDTPPLRQAYAALTHLILESARSNHTSIQFQSILEEGSTLSASSIQLLGQAFEQKKDLIRRRLLQNIGIGGRQLVDVEWRLDYHVTSSATGNDNIPIYHVTFKLLDDQGQPQEIKMTCSLEEMQDLTAKIRDATKQVERILSSGGSSIIGVN